MYHFLLSTSKSLVAYVMLSPYRLIEQNLILELEMLFFFLILRLSPKVTFCMTLPPTLSLSLELSYSMSHVSLSKYINLYHLLLLLSIPLLLPLHQMKISLNLCLINPILYPITNLTLYLSLLNQTISLILHMCPFNTLLLLHPFQPLLLLKHLISLPMTFLSTLWLLENQLEW